MPHDRFYGRAAAEIAEQRPDRDLFARAYAIALGDAEKTKAVYIGIRAERLEEEAMFAARREAEIERAHTQQELERAKREAAALRKKPLPQKIDVPPVRAKAAAVPQSEPPQVTFSDPEMAKAVQAMCEALKASRFENC